MSLLTRTPAGRCLQDARFNIYGYLEGSGETNLRGNPVNTGRVFDVLESDKGYLNQLALSFERTVRNGPGQWDLGGRVDLVYGSDARFTPSSDFLNHQGAVAPNGIGRSELWFDVPQVYADMELPVGNGLRLRLGKFEFFKKMNPLDAVFYSHSYEFGQAFPFSLTGIDVHWSISPSLSIDAGLSRGWDQTFTDNNTAIDGFGRFSWAISDRAWFSTAWIVGPEQYHDNSHYTIGGVVTFNYQLTEQVLVLLDATIGHQWAAQQGNFPGSNMPPSGSGSNIGDADWDGLDAVTVWKLSALASLALRIEWYHDGKGFTTRGDGRTQELYEITLGVTIAPFCSTFLGQNVLIRPEVRYDYSTRRYFSLNAQGNPTRHDQVTLAVDAIIVF